MGFLKKYLITAVVFLLLDSFWLGFLAKEMYQDRLGPVINLQFDIQAGVFFYLIYIAGIVYFALTPALEENSWQRALVKGVLLGLLCYATYDLTNMATIKDWPIFVVIVDLLWGMFITATSCVVAFWVIRKFSVV